MHELRCIKNINYKGKICNICNRIISISDEEKHCHCKYCNNLFTKSSIQNHILLNHELIKCAKCNNEFTGESYILHTSNMKICPICELRLFYCEYDEHFKYCASKTTRCDYCKKYITFLKIEEHFYTSHRGKQCPYKIGNFDPSTISTHKNENKEVMASEMEIEKDDDDEDNTNEEKHDDDTNDEEEEEELIDNNNNSDENDYDEVKSESEGENIDDEGDSD